MSQADQATGEATVLEIDPFSDEFLSDPYPYHDEMRRAGPVVFLSLYRVWAVACDAEARAVLQDWETFCSSAGVGLSDFRKEKPWRPPSLLLEADPPDHTKPRMILTKIMAPKAVRDLKDRFEAEAEALVDRVVAKGEFDAQAELAEAYPLTVFPDAVGISKEGRENLLPYGTMAFNAFGPQNDLFKQAMSRAEEVIPWIMANCKREALAPGGFGQKIYEFADAGEVTEEEAGMLVRSFLTAGVDTTVNGLGNAFFAFLNAPEQWDALHADPSLAKQAFEEVLRFESPVQTFFRTTTRKFELAGVELGEGEKILCFLGAANRDPAKWDQPDEFDISRRASGHLGFGTGIHGCVGQAVARMEAECLLAALARRVKRIEPTGEPVRRLNNTLRGMASLPVRVTPA